ncbi:MAG: UDP-N-acetylmuramoyl-L-alanine--D-glutamate ligase, partial [Ignavibacteria bacterium]|nr:UDP-N-acetylmuramoyl-L-alanine--D-glutamate ligase [Ignavibacteria bacterium]
KENGVRIHTGVDYLEATQQYDTILKAPGIPGFKLQITNNQTLSSQTDLFLMAYHSQTIGITGTKGKSTTSSLIFHLLKESGTKCILTGNIGIPCFDSIPQIEDESIIVFELSANQLENVRHSPHIAVLLNIFEEHLDHFGTFEAYEKAKTMIFKYSGSDDTIIIHESLNELLNQSQAKVKLFPQENLVLEVESKLPGQHNQLNIQAALHACIAIGKNMNELNSSIATFKGLSHRLEFIGNAKGINFYNDSIATIPEATIAALETLKKVDFLILGGFDRGIQYEKLITYLNQHPVKIVLYTGKAGARIASELKLLQTHMQLFSFQSMEEAFDIIQKKAFAGATCLLSPAAASYDQYKNFEHRGETFKNLVNKLIES